MNTPNMGPLPLFDKKVLECEQICFIRSETDLINLKNVDSCQIEFSIPSQQAGQTGLMYSSPDLRCSSELETQNHPQHHTLSELPEHEEVNVFDSDFSVYSYSDKKKFFPEYFKDQSEYEISKQHEKIQRRYSYKAESKDATVTDIDFEGILNLIGGLNTWQIIIFVLLAVHQIPHAMFNLGVIYMMYQPDHWCQTNNITKQHLEVINFELGDGWTWNKIMSSGVLFPLLQNDHMRGIKHDQCHYYERDPYILSNLLSNNFSESELRNVITKNKSVILKDCKQWNYDKSIMRETIVTKYNKVCDGQSTKAYVHLSYSLGCVVGCLLGGFLSDRFGRKVILFSFAILATLFAVLLPTVCNEASSVGGYVLCMELSGIKYRSMMGILLQIPSAIGYLLLAFLGHSTRSWPTVHYLTTALHSISLVFIYFVPESPRWLIVCDKFYEAEQIIRKACRYNKKSLPSGLELVRHSEKSQWVKDTERPTFLHLFQNRYFIVRNGIVFMCWAITGLLYYEMEIQLTQITSLIKGDIFTNNIISGLLEIPVIFGCLILCNLTRRTSQLITLFGSSLFLLSSMVLLFYNQTEGSFILFILGKMCIVGAFNILFVYTCELYPTVLRSSAFGFFCMAGRIGSLVCGYVVAVFDTHIPMTIFVCFCLIGGILVIFLPETKDLPLPETIWDAIEFDITNNSSRSKAKSSGQSIKKNMSYKSNKRNKNCKSNKSHKNNTDIMSNMNNEDKCSSTKKNLLNMELLGATKSSQVPFHSTD